jgi:pimeloyl-ACP methyl ester carboxylesterase
MSVHPDQSLLTSTDGTSISWYHLGRGAPVVLAGGLLGRYVVWRSIWDALADRYRFIGWDYRGLWGSSRPSDFDRFSLDWHAEDQRCAMDEAGVERALLVGWSTGVQVNFEFYRRWPERVAAMVAICGTYGRAFEGALGWSGTQHVIPRAAQAATEMRELVSSTLGRLAGSRRLVQYLKLTGAVAPTADEEALLTMANELADLDVPAFMAVVRCMEEQDATELLEHVTVPVLVLAGDRDVLVPLRVARKMARRIPEAELTVLPGATHYAPIEYPELISLRVEKFLRDIGYGQRVKELP